jgi:dihydroorotase
LTRLLLKGFRLIDPAVPLDRVADVLVVDGVVAEIGRDLTAEAQVVEGAGLWLVPGLFDPHVHLRTPGETEKETLASGLAAAHHGGFTGVGAMANTRPPLDTAEAIAAVKDAAPRLGVALHQYGAATLGLCGEEPADYEAYRRVGVRAVSDDGHGIGRASVLRRVLEGTARAGLTLILHEEDEELSGRAPVNEGPVASRLGLPGQPGAAEAGLLARDLVLLEAFGGKVHIAHVSTRAAVEVLRWAKGRGLNVSAEVTPHHLFLAEEAVLELGGVAKMNPPLRGEEDRRAILSAFLDGTIEVLATDHAPHTRDEKSRDIGCAPFGVAGLETALGLMLDRLVRPGLLSPSALVERMSHGPRRVLGLPPVTLRVGERAEFTAIDPEARWRVEAGRLRTQAGTTPFEGQELTGRAVGILSDGEWRPC